jgi:hypothetical protein
MKRIQNKYFKNLSSLIKLQRKIKSFLKLKIINQNRIILSKEKNKEMNKGIHKPNKSSLRFKQNRLSISNLNSNDVAFNININDNTNLINSNSN